MKRTNAYRNGMVHVLEAMCSTCIFRPGNRMGLAEGRVEDLVETNTKNNSALVCHSTLDDFDLHAVCHGFFKLHATQPLQVAERLDFIEFDPVPVKEDTHAGP